MLLVVDIGNTTTKVGVWGRGSVLGLSVSPTHDGASPGEFVCQVMAAACVAGDPEVALCSVVPEATRAWEEWCRQSTRRLFVLRGDTATPLANRYRTPERLGPDRLAMAVGAARRCGAPVIVASLGTTVVIDAVSSAGEYLGGAIWVGISSGFGTLAESTAALPRATGDAVFTPIGADTQTCIRAGAMYGTVSLVDGLVARMREVMGEDAPLLLTGGDAELLSPYLATEHEVVPTLTLEGVAAIWEHNREGSDANR
jgi:type III pantothenate kinase